MKTTALGWIFILFLFPFSAFGIDIVSISPKVVFSGVPVTVIGGPFSADVVIDLGGRQLQPQSSGPRQLTFITPELPAGEYALFLLDGGKASKTLSLMIEFPPPLISEISPVSLDVCSTPEERLVSLHGEHIQDGAQLLFDGAVVSMSRKDETFFSFTPPPLPAGNYELQLVNPDGKKSLPQLIWFSDQPEIEAVEEGDNFVNSYQILIRGKNFFHNSVLLVDEYPGEVKGLRPRQRQIPAQGGAVFDGDNPRPGQTENVSYQDCRTLIYNRYPVSGQAIRMLLRVGNPDGGQTEPYEVFLP